MAATPRAKAATPPPPEKTSEPESGMQPPEAVSLEALATRIDGLEESLATLQRYWQSQWAFTNDTVSDLSAVVIANEEHPGAVQFFPESASRMVAVGFDPGDSTEDPTPWFTPDYLR